MKTRLVISAILTLAILAYSQTRQDTYDANTVKVSTIKLDPLPDGGCQAKWCGSVVSSGSIVLRECTDYVEFKQAANVNRCNQLAEAGKQRLLKALAFPVDAGNE